jgi:hypothetical protein
LEKETMRASYVIIGAYFLTLGASLIALGPIFASLVTTGVLWFSSSLGTGALAQGLWLSILGTILAPLGAAVLAYGLGTTASSSHVSAPGRTTG